jgi:hypothetical protein
MSKKYNVSEKNSGNLVFDKINYQLMIAGVVVIALGFVIMSLETAEYGFGFLGLTLGPIVVLLGFALEFVAILYKPKQKDGAN